MLRSLFSFDWTPKSKLHRVKIFLENRRCHDLFFNLFQPDFDFRFSSWKIPVMALFTIVSTLSSKTIRSWWSRKSFYATCAASVGVKRIDLYSTRSRELLYNRYDRRKRIFIAECECFSMRKDVENKKHKFKYKKNRLQRKRSADDGAGAKEFPFASSPGCGRNLRTLPTVREASTCQKASNLDIPILLRLR